MSARHSLGSWEVNAGDKAPGQAGQGQSGLGLKLGTGLETEGFEAGTGFCFRRVTLELQGRTARRRKGEPCGRLGQGSGSR